MCDAVIGHFVTQLRVIRPKEVKEQLYIISLHPIQQHR